MVRFFDWDRVSELCPKPALTAYVGMFINPFAEGEGGLERALKAQHLDGALAGTRTGERGFAPSDERDGHRRAGQNQQP